MLGKKLQIIGLGRCVIGHIANQINSTDSIQADFKHHYLLNYESILNSHILDKEIKTLKNIEVMPTLHDQWYCLNQINEYDVCLIEIFPSSPIYHDKKRNLFASFESFTEELQKEGFVRYGKNTDYIQILHKLILKIKNLNRRIKIILINGELVKENNGAIIGSRYLYELFAKIEKLTTVIKDISFLDMNNLINNLENQQKYYFELAFPYLYLRNDKNTNDLTLCRDCKHTIPEVREEFLLYFITIIKTFGFQINIENKNNFRMISFGNTFKERALNYIDIFNKSHDGFGNLTCPKKFSLIISYSLEVNDVNLDNSIINYIEKFSIQYPTNLIDLKDKFYFIRVIVAFIYNNKILMYDVLSRIGINILKISNDIRVNKNFALIWLKDISITIIGLIKYEKNYSKKSNIQNFFNNLEYKKEYKEYSEIRFLVNQYKEMIINDN